MQAVKALLPDSRVYVFGSVLKGEAVGGSDVDVLIVSSLLPVDNLSRAEIKARVEELASLPPYHPFELHLADESEAKWYFSRVKELVEVTDAG
ncbi:nucleotidyltransferase domain-containing protein [Infirmifilum lucidum]|uniref:nucleotidyltransferase domain-containing protein n=1 Tax=Infirmifilum lucidum TaxID=2776706 RepID=UPI001C3F8688|nr:nucleotidyltransferase domain-containing protein [Infirmifilum lucidum]